MHANGRFDQGVDDYHVDDHVRLTCIFAQISIFLCCQSVSLYSSETGVSAGNWHLL